MGDSLQRKADFLFRRPTEQDLASVAEIYNYAVRETIATFDTEEKAPEQFKAFVGGSHLYRMMLAECDGQVVGYVGTYPFSQRKAYAELAEIMLYIHPAWQKKGVGRALLNAVHGSDFFAGLHTVLALMNKESVYLHRVFEALDYECKGEMVDVAFKFGRRHSLVIYQPKTSLRQYEHRRQLSML